MTVLKLVLTLTYQSIKKICRKLVDFFWQNVFFSKKIFFSRIWGQGGQKIDFFSENQKSEHMTVLKLVLTLTYQNIKKKYRQKIFLPQKWPRVLTFHPYDQNIGPSCTLKLPIVLQLNPNE